MLKCVTVFKQPQQNVTPSGMLISLPLTASYAHLIYTQGLANSFLSIFTCFIDCFKKINYIPLFPLMWNSWRNIAPKSYNKESLTRLLEINACSWFQPRFAHLVLESGTQVILMPTPPPFHQVLVETMLRMPTHLPWSQLLLAPTSHLEFPWIQDALSHLRAWTSCFLRFSRFLLLLLSLELPFQ